MMSYNSQLFMKQQFVKVNSRPKLQVPVGCLGRLDSTSRASGHFVLPLLLLGHDALALAAAPSFHATSEWTAVLLRDGPPSHVD